MALNGIDVSNWQSGINLAVVPADFVIVKATEGLSYVSPSCDRQYQQAKAAGRKLGVYHYADGKDAKSEAAFFLKNIQGYIHEAILVLDWESQNNPKFNSGQDKTWVKTWCDYVAAQTGVKPLVYISAASRGLVSGIGDYGLWIAQYANNNQTGYQSKPWNEGAYSCVIRQYSSAGRLSGYNGNLDLNKFYGDRATWDKYANPGGTPAPTPAPENPQVPGEAVNNAGLSYRAHVADYGWLDAVHDGQVAGTTGKSKQLEAIKITPPDGLELTVQVHVQDKGWVTYEGVKKGASSGEGSSPNDPIMGTVGESKRIEAIEITPTKNTTGKKLMYQVHVAGHGWTGWVEAGGATGTTGILTAIEAIQMKLV